MLLKNLPYAGIAYCATLIVCIGLGGMKENPDPVTPYQYSPQPPITQQSRENGPYDITSQVPSEYLSYEGVQEWMKRWHEEAPKITEFGTYGQNRQGTDLCYLRIGTPGQPRVLIHAAIHGNERLSTAAVLGIMGKMLHDYKRNDEVTWLVDNREIYFAPVFSPESYLKDRHVEGGDPNRNWAYPGSRINNSSSPIQAMQAWFLKMKFCAAIDGHTWGRDFFYPSLVRGSDREKMKALATEMSDMAGYSPNPVGNRPIGYAIDWYYWKGAVSLVTEFGAGGHDAPPSAIPVEVEKTYGAYLLFIRKAPEMELEGLQESRPFFNPPRAQPFRRSVPMRRYYVPSLRRHCVSCPPL